MRSRHPFSTLTLVAAGCVLLIAIAIGQRLGDRVLSQATERRSPIVAPLTTPVPDPTNPGLEKNWKRQQVISVATDPAFPDPRVTPPPRPTPRPPPPPTPTPRPTPSPPVMPPSYTSPPLPLPLVSHAPGETESEPPGAPPNIRGTIPPSFVPRPPESP